MKHQLQLIKDAVEMMDLEGQARVASIKIAIEECVDRDTDCGPIALVIVAMERSIEG